VVQIDETQRSPVEQVDKYNVDLHNPFAVPGHLDATRRKLGQFIGEVFEVTILYKKRSVEDKGSELDIVGQKVCMMRCQCQYNDHSDSLVGVQTSKCVV
jgi:hypothetical protein